MLDGIIEVAYCLQHIVFLIGQERFAALFCICNQFRIYIWCLLYYSISNLYINSCGLYYLVESIYT